MNTLNIITQFDERSNTDLRSLTELQNDVLPHIEQLLLSSGYSQLQYDREHSAYRVLCKGSFCLIMLAEPARSPMEIHALSEEQCRWAEETYPSDDILWCTLFLNGNQFLFTQPSLIRKNGAWITDNSETEQFLPECRVSGGTYMARAILGDAFVLKLKEFLIYPLTENGVHPHYTIKNLLENEEANFPYTTRYATTPPCWIILQEKKGEQYNVRPVFYHCDPPFSTLKLENIRPDYPLTGHVELLHPNGNTYIAECLEATIFGTRLPRHRYYKWALSLFAETVHLNDQNITITKGAFYELQKEEYRKEHGTEPPEDFAITVSTKEMRTVQQNEDGQHAAYCSITGVIREIEDATLSPHEFPGGHCLRVQLSCVPDEDVEEETLVSVYLSQNVLKDYTPSVGDNIRCSGNLLAAPDELCKEEESPDEVDEKQPFKERRAAIAALDFFSECSLGYSTALSAFIDGGWDIVMADPAEFSRRHFNLVLKSPDGEIAAVFVDTVVNGNLPNNPMSELRTRIEKYCLDGNSIVRACYFCTVNLDYMETIDRYKVSMSVAPPCEGVENHLIMIAPANRQSILNFHNGEASEEQLRSEKLDEAMIARIFRDAFAKGKWDDFAKWLREELRYTSATNGTSLHSKMDFLRYITERVEDWKYGGNHLWPHFRFSAGTVLYHGVRRPCTATYFDRILANITVFDDYKGLVGSFRTINKSTYCTYIEEGMPYNENELTESDIIEPKPYIKFPPYSCTEAVKAESFANDDKADNALRNVLKYLEDKETPAVGHPSETGPLPHIWFRKQDMSLCYVILVQQGTPAPEGAIPLHQLMQCIGEDEYENLKKIKDYCGYLAYSSSNNAVILRAIPKLH